MRYPLPPLNERVTRIYVDPNLPQKDVDIAISDWNHAMNGSYYLLTMPWEEYPSPPAVVLRAAHSDDAAILRGGNNAAAVQYPWVGTYPSSIIYVDMDKSHDNKRIMIAILEHELGHAYGADHMDGTLMAPVVGDHQCIDQKTIEAVAKRLHLDPQYLNHC
jgi:hypothetical protein